MFDQYDLVSTVYVRGRYRVSLYGAAHDGKLPRTLDDLPVPAPLEPFTGKPLEYEFHGKFAVLKGHKMPGLQYRLILRFADKDK